MYENYSFVLEWDELPDHLRDDKIDAFITSNYNNGGYVNSAGEHDVALDDLLADSSVRGEAESDISARFPIYF